MLGKMFILNLKLGTKGIYEILFGSRYWSIAIDLNRIKLTDMS